MNGAAQAEGSDLVLDPFPDSKGPSHPDEVPVYGALLTLLQIGSFDLDKFELPKKLDPSAWYQIRTYASGRGIWYKVKIQFLTNDYLKLRVSKALLSQKFDLPKSAPQTFEFVGIREKRAVKYDRSKVSKEAQEIASKGYIGNPPGGYKPNHEEGRSAQ